jgi:phosphatidate phosphatase LPIN
MQYVRSLGSGVSKTWNSINPATLSGAIDVIVIEQEDGSLACSPFHVRFGKFSLLRPSEKRVEFRVNGRKQNYAMKLGDTGEAFFVFETSNAIPEALQTSPLSSPATSPQTSVLDITDSTELTEPTPLDISDDARLSSTPDLLAAGPSIPRINRENTAISDQIPYGSHQGLTPDIRPADWEGSSLRPATLERAASEEVLPAALKQRIEEVDDNFRKRALSELNDRPFGKASASPPALEPRDAYNRAMTLSKKLSTSNIRSKVTESGDLMLDMTGYKSSEDEALRAEAVARKLLSEELEGNYDIGSLIGTDEHGNLWIYSSEEAKDAANRKALGIGTSMGLSAQITTPEDASFDQGYHSDSERSISPALTAKNHQRAKSEEIPAAPRMSAEGTRNFAKTLRLTSDQLKDLELKPGANPMSFTVGRATCPAVMYYWTAEVPIVISDIDGTITKSDALGHLLNMVGRDWTHLGVAKLYTEIVGNGYNILYLTSRSVGQADTTRAYLAGINQEGWKLPKGPVIMSPDRTIAALRREVYLRKPELFKMACLRDILGLFPGRTNAFYAGFGNRFTDALSYRTVNIPSTRIFTINTNSEVSIDLLSLSKYRSSYVSMRELVDHFFPPVSTLVKEGGEEYTDFSYWRDAPQDLDDWVPTDSSGSEAEGEDDDDDEAARLGESYISRDSVDQSNLGDSIRESIEVDDMEEDVRRLRIVDSREDIERDYLGSQSQSEDESPFERHQREQSSRHQHRQQLEDISDDDEDEDEEEPEPQRPQTATQRKPASTPPSPNSPRRTNSTTPVPLTPTRAKNSVNGALKGRRS